MKKILGALVLLSVMMLLPSAIAGEGNVAFYVDIVIDTTVTIPTLCETGTPNTVLNFTPGITALADAEARPIDSCNSAEQQGDYNITNAGNVPINITFSLDQAPPTGINVAIGDQETYDVANYAELDNTTAKLPLWSQNVPVSGVNQVVNIWQRVAADDSALGGIGHSMQILISSAYQI